MVCYIVQCCRLLGARIAELEHRLKVLEISGLWSTPGYDIDESLKDGECDILWDEEEKIIESSSS